jgi:predicted permease
LTPQLPRVYQVGGFAAATRLEWVSEVASSVMTIAISLLPVAFEIYAFYRLFDRYGFDDVMVWAALALTVLALISTLASYVDDARRTRYVVTPGVAGP